MNLARSRIQESQSKSEVDVLMWTVHFVQGYDSVAFEGKDLAVIRNLLTHLVGAVRLMNDPQR
jgi:hypothetical protein